MAHLILRDGWAKLIDSDQALPHLAEKLGITERTLSRILSGHVPPDEPFIAGCLFHFPVDFAELFEVTQETGPVEELPLATAL